jgi:hypothetical protein
MNLNFSLERQLKSGKAVNEDDIPPVVAVGKRKDPGTT